MRASHRTALFHCLLLLLLPVTPCVMLAQQGPPRPGTLELIAADPSRGFYWPYYLVVPDTVKSTTTLVLDPTDAPLAQNQSYRDFTPDATAAQRADYFGFEFFRELGTALVMPVLPHLPSERLPNGDVFWVLHLDPDIFTVSDPSLYRIDLQIVAMIADARARLTTQGIQAAEKVFVDGISSVGIFANRFSILHPQLVQAVAIGAAGIHTMPLAQWQGRNLAYPLGTANLAALAGTAFDARRYRRMPQYVYVGVEDRNENAFLFDPDAAAVARELFGADVPTRFASASAVFASQGNDAVFTTYAGAGHELTAAMMNDIRAFFRAHATRPDEIAGVRKDGVASDALFALGLTRDSGATWLGGARVDGLHL